MKKRISMLIALILVLAMSAAMFVGCVPTTQEPAPSDAPEESKAPVDEPADDEPAPEEPTGEPLMRPNGKTYLDYEIFVAADGIGDHPIFAALTDAAAMLADIGITLNINDPAEANVMWDALDAGVQDLWCAAWGSTIDPDMYQVYHSSNIVGLGGSDSNHYHIASEELDNYILEARQSDDQAFRKATYRSALDVIMDWAVELPTYQRKNCIAFSTERIKMETVTPDITTFWGWMNDIELIEMADPASPLVVAYADFSEKFSPFVADTGYDMDAVSMTQLSLMTTDRMGGIIYNAIEGETVNYNGTDYLYTGPADLTVDYDEAANLTTYTAKMRQDLVFSDGKPVTADDLIFTYYVYLDTSYVGSTTLDSYPIVGLKAYEANNSLAENLDTAAMLADIANDAELQQAIIDSLIVPVLTSEVEWVRGLYGDPDYKSYTDAYAEVKDLFAMFYSIDEAYDSTAAADEAAVLADIIAQYGYDYAALGAGYGGDPAYFNADVEAIALELGLSRAGQGEEVPNISGITKIDDYTVQVVTYGYEAPAVYSILGQQVAPLHYYGDPAMYDYENNSFGFPRGDVSIIEAKTTEPMGAGAYKFIKFENGVIYYEANDLYFKGAPKTKNIQFKETTSSEVAAGIAAGTVDAGEMTGSKAYYEEVRGYNSNNELIGDVVTISQVDNLGYGYIGANADTVCIGEPGSDASKNLRKAIMTIISVCRDTCINSYYGDAATAIQYPISNTSWAAPQATDAGYQIAFSKDVNGADIYTPDMSEEQKYEAAKAAALGFLEAAGFEVVDGMVVAGPTA